MEPGAYTEEDPTASASASLLLSPSLLLSISLFSNTHTFTHTHTRASRTPLVQCVRLVVTMRRCDAAIRRAPGAFKSSCVESVHENTGRGLTPTVLVVVVVVSFLGSASG